MKIYIAGPYSAESRDGKIRNTNVAIDVGLTLLHRGHYPFIPHLTHYVDERAEKTGVGMSWEDYVRWDMIWLELCDALLYLGDSPGAKLELKAAQDWGKTIFYSLDEIEEAIENS